MNNKAYKNLIAFTFAFFVLFSANSAFAAVTASPNDMSNMNYHQYNNNLYSHLVPSYAPTSYSPMPTYQIAQTGYVNPAGDPVSNFINTQSSGNNVTTRSTAASSSGTSTSKNTSVVKKVETKSSSNLQTMEAVSDKDSESSVSADNLTALSMRGRNVFMPDTVLEWLLTIVFILLIVIAFRLIIRSKKHQ
jgi:hypothetical protein